MRRSWVLLAALASACTTTPIAPRDDALFRDELFGPPTERIAAEDIFALSEPMRRYLREDIADRLRLRGPQFGLVEALRGTGQLKLEYDAAVTRNAAEAFAAKSGNCLSLVIMTAALARELGVPVRYQSAYLEETWSRAGNLLVRSGHVNVTLDRRLLDADRYRFTRILTVDFLPAEDIRGLRTYEIGEATIVAMYMNNRAVEAFVQGRVDDAYAWVRESIRHDAAFVSSYNTLGVLYLDRGALDAAAQMFERVLAARPDNTRAMANLAETLARQGKSAEAATLRERLAGIETAAPFHYFNLGRAAMERGDYAAARDHFAKELARAGYNAEFQHWMGVASYRLGDHAAAAHHLALAREYSTTRGDRELYAAKLAWLKAHASVP